MLDSVFIKDLKVDTVIGICEWEKQVPQTLHFDVEMQTDISAAANSDDIAEALDYAAVAEHIGRLVESSTCLLIETLVSDIGNSLLTNFPAIEKLVLTVRKPQALASAANTGITISRTRL